MWWPQKGVERVVTWQARRMLDADYNDQTGPRGALRPKRYQALGDVPYKGLARPASAAVQWAGGKFYDTLDSAGAARRALEERLPFAAPLGRAASQLFGAHVLPAVLKQFVPVDTNGPQRFWDSWHDGLPMDNQMSDASLPTTFTEIFVPLEETQRAMKILRHHFRAGGLDATGSFIFEIYAARRTRGWLHPAYERDSLRIDVFWFERSSGDPIGFFEQFWDLFAPLGYRLHWGKHLPRDPSRGWRYLRRQFPRWDDFLRLRAELDPHGVFLNAHFRAALGVEEADLRPYTADAAVEAPPPSVVAAPPAQPLAFRIQAFYEELAHRREPALERLNELFSEDVVFRDPFRDTRGIAELRELFVRMFRQYREVGFTGFHIAGDEDAFTMTYDMHLRMTVGPGFVTPMCSVFTARDGKVERLVDYYDFASGLVSPAGVAREAYRWLARKLFL
jgi:ketosteroid isomerase-like protein